MEPDLRAAYRAAVEHSDQEIDLEYAAFLIAKEARPGLDLRRYRDRLDALGAGAARVLRQHPAQGAVDRMRRFVRFMSEQASFHGNLDDYDDPRNYLIDQVLLRRVGIPITLGTVYMLVGRRAGLDLRGIGFPGHFLVKAAPDDDNDAAVFLDPFYGALLAANDLRALLQRVAGDNATLAREHLAEAGARAMLTRMLRNLKRVYWEAGDYVQALAAAERIVLTVGDEPNELRDRGFCYMKLRLYDAARVDLERFLAAVPGDPSAPVVRRVLAEIGDARSWLH